MCIKMRSVYAPGPSSIQICNTTTYTDYSEGAGPDMNKLPLTSMGAIYSGLFQTQRPNGKSSMISCPTGNFTFAPYQTLGFCSRGANITDSLHLSMEGLSTMMNYYYRLQNGLQLNTAYTMPYIMNSTAGLDLLKLDMDGAAVILNFTAISSAGSGILPKPSATECALFFCVDTYEAFVTEGVFNENRISTDVSSNATPFQTWEPHKTFR